MIYWMDADNPACLFFWLLVFQMTSLDKAGLANIDICDFNRCFESLEGSEKSFLPPDDAFS